MKTLLVPMLTLVAVLIALPSGANASAAHEGAEQPDYLPAWECDAWPTYGYGVPTYWISTNLSYAQYQAVSSCTFYNARPCSYRCYPNLL